MKLIDKILIKTSKVVTDTAATATWTGQQLFRLAYAVAKLTEVVNEHARVLRELQEFHKQLAEGLQEGDLSVIVEKPLDEEAKKRLN